jgi:hypothetical protein
MRVASCISGGATTTTTARTRHWTTAHQQSSPLPVLSPRCVSRSWTGGFAETVAQVSASSKDVERYGPNRTTQAEIAILRWLRNAGRVNQPETNSRLGTEILVRSAEKFLRYTSSSNGTKDRALQMGSRQTTRWPGTSEVKYQDEPFGASDQGLPTVLSSYAFCKMKKASFFLPSSEKRPLRL